MGEANILVEVKLDKPLDKPFPKLISFDDK